MGLKEPKLTGIRFDGVTLVVISIPASESEFEAS